MFGSMMGESSKAVGLIPAGIVSLAAGEAKGLAFRSSAVLRQWALNPHLAARLSAMLLLGFNSKEEEPPAMALTSSTSIAERSGESVIEFRGVQSGLGFTYRTEDATESPRLVNEKDHDFASSFACHGIESQRERFRNRLNCTDIGTYVEWCSACASLCCEQTSQNTTFFFWNPILKIYIFLFLYILFFPKKFYGVIKIYINKIK